MGFFFLSLHTLSTLHTFHSTLHTSLSPLHSLHFTLSTFQLQNIHCWLTHSCSVEQIVDALEKRKTKDNLALARALFLQNLLYPRDLELRLRLTTRIVELYPKYVSAIAIRASILFIASQEKFSFSELDKIYSFNPRYPVASRKANLLAQAGRKEEAITLLQNSIEHDKPAISNVHTLFSLLATLDKDMQIRMVTSGNKVIKNMVGFEHPDLSLLLPSIHHFFGNWDLCIECCTESLSGRKNADKEMLKRLRTQCKRMKHALKLFQPLEKLIPNTAPYYSQHPTISQFIRNLDISATISSQQFDENWESFVTCIAYISHSQTLDGNCVPIDLLKYRVKLTADFIQQVYKSENRTNLMRGSCHSHIVADWLEKFQKKGAGAIIFSTAYTKEQALHVADALKQKIPLSTYLLKNHYY